MSSRTSTSASAPVSNRQKIADLLVIFAILLMCVLIYGQTLEYGFISFDDPVYVTENERVHAGLSADNFAWACTTFAIGNWHPLTWLSLMLDAQLYGLNAGGFHLTNLMLHALAALLLYGWLRTLLREQRWVAAFVALAFAAHPTHVESVAWVTERKDVLAAVFLFAALWAWTRYARTTADDRGRRWLYAASLGAFALGLMAKSMIVTLPVLLLLLDWWPLRRWPMTRRCLVEKIPFAVLAAGAAALTMLAARMGGALASSVIAIPWWRRAGGVAVTVLAYVGRTIWPSGLSPCYDYPTLTWSPTALALAAGAVILLTALTFWQARARPWLTMGWLWYLVTLLPVSGIVPVGNQPMPDRFTYLPHVGLFLMLALAAAEAVRAWPRARTAVLGAGVAALVACGWLSWRQTAFWRDGVTLFERALAVNGPTSRARTRVDQLLGCAYLDNGRDAEAAARFTEALQIQDGNDLLSLDKLGYLCVRHGRWQEAAGFFTHALKLYPDDPPLLNSLGLALFKLGQNAAAQNALARSLQRRPDYGPAHFNLALLFQTQGDVAAAAQHYEQALATNPEWLAALDGLATAQAALGQWDEAVRTAEAALALETSELRQERLDYYRRRQIPPH